MARNCFQKGVSGNPKGKPKGCKNKITGKSREMIQNFCEGYLSKIEEDFEQLEPKDRIKVFSDLLPFYLAKCQSVNISADVQSTTKIDLIKAINEEYSYSELGERIDESETPLLSPIDADDVHSM